MLFNCIYGHHIFGDVKRHRICNLFPPGPLPLIWDTMGNENDSTNVTCFLAGVLGLPLSCETRSATHFCCLAACLCLRCWNKFVVLLPLVATDFRQTLHRTVVCSRSDLAEPNHFQTTEEMCLFGNELLTFINTCCHVDIYYQHGYNQHYAISVNYGSSGKR